MLRLWIILLALVVKAFFSKIEGTYFQYDFFPMSDIKMILPEYLWHITFYFAFACLAWDFYLQELKYKKQMLVFAILMSMELLDFILRANMTYFHVGSYPFSFDSIMLVTFGATLITTRK